MLLEALSSGMDPCNTQPSQPMRKTVPLSPGQINAYGAGLGPKPGIRWQARPLSPRCGASQLVNLIL